jgi:hypothetical protein
MAKLTPKSVLLFAGSDPNLQILKLGSTVGGSPTQSTDPDVLMANAAKGWGGATYDVNSGQYKLPIGSEMNGLDYSISYYLKQLQQSGIAEWTSTQDYHVSNITKDPSSTKIYTSLSNNNTNNVLTDTNNWKFLADLQALSSLYSLENRNAIINGDFRISQYGPSITNPTNGQYVLDRWRTIYGGSGMQCVVSKQFFTPDEIRGPGLYSPNYARIVISNFGTSSYGLNFTQPIEDVRTFAGQTITVAFGLRSSVNNKSFDIGLVQNFGVGGSTAVTIPSQTVTATNTNFNRYVLTFTIPAISTSATIGNNSFLDFVVQIPTAGGTGTFDFDHIGNTLFTYSTTYNIRPLSIEYLLCKRYYRSSYINAPAGTIQTGIPTSTLNAYQLRDSLVRFDTSMRIAPAISIYSPVTGASGVVSVISGSAADKAVSATSITQDYFNIYSTQLTGSGNSYLDLAAQYHYTANAEL